MSGGGDGTERATDSYAPCQRRAAGYIARSLDLWSPLSSLFVLHSPALPSTLPAPANAKPCPTVCLRVPLSPPPALPFTLYRPVVRPHPRRSSGSRPGGPASGWTPGLPRDLLRSIRTAVAAAVAASTLEKKKKKKKKNCLLYTSPSPRDRQKSRMPSSA